MPDLSTTYLGLTLKNPLVVSASPLCEEIEHLRRMEDAGAAAAVDIPIIASLSSRKLTAVAGAIRRERTFGRPHGDPQITADRYPGPNRKGLG